MPGRDYNFVDRRGIQAAASTQDEFLEHAQVFDNFYGTGRAQVEALRNAGHDVILEIDWQGAQQVRKAQPDCKTVFILPPSRVELETRLRNRKTDSDEVIERRLRDAVADMSHYAEFDYVIVNDDFETAVRSAARDPAWWGNGVRRQKAGPRAPAGRPAGLTAGPAADPSRRWSKNRQIPACFQ